MDPAALVKAVRNIRDAEAEIRREADAKIAELKEKREKIEGVLLQVLTDSNVESMRTANGTFFRTVETIPSGQDWDAFYNWIKENDAFDALERRITRKFISDYMNAHDGAIPPGVNVFRRYKVNVRKNTGETATLGD